MEQPSLRQNGGVRELQRQFQVISQIWVDIGLEHLKSSSSEL